VSPEAFAKPELPDEEDDDDYGDSGGDLPWQNNEKLLEELFRQVSAIMKLSCSQSYDHELQRQRCKNLQRN
jgi:hypothetical protein